LNWIFGRKFVVVGVASASRPQSIRPNNFALLGSNFDDNKVGLDLCPACINEVVELINVALNVILDEGIIDSCAKLCQAVYNKSGSKDLGDLCDLLCDGVGIDEFIHILITADIDPIYYCQVVDMCPVNDHGDAKFTNFGVYPQTGPQGTTFVIDLTFKTVNGTGTGTFTFNIIDPKNQTSGDLYWFEEKKAGTYPYRIGFKTYTISTCDLSKGGVCDDFPVGTYNVTAQVCNGECGSHHPHTAIYDSQASSFVVTKKK